MKQNLYVIESRDSEGALLLGRSPQPESAFGIKAVTGITDSEMARVIFDKLPNSETVVLDGGNVVNWPRFICPNWVARRKTW